MNYRYHATLLTFMVGLLASLGCASGRQGGPATTTVMCPAPSCDGTSGELTSGQAAQLCLTTAEALEKKGYTAEAIRQYENARVHDPHLPSVSRRLAVLYDLQGDPQHAEAEYLRAEQEQPGDAELLNDLGYFHYRHDRLDAASTWLHNAVSVDPNCRCAWINLGQVLAKQGRLEDSYQAFARVLRPAEAYSNLGVLLAKQGRTSEARTALQQALQLDPTLQQPQAFLSALPAAPALLPPGITYTHPPAPIKPTPTAVVVAPPSPPALLPTTPPPALSYRPPAPSLSPKPTPAPAIVYLPPPPVVAPTSPDPLPIIRTLRQPSVGASAPLPPTAAPTPVASIVSLPAMPAILHQSQTLSPAAPFMTPASPPSRPFILQVSPPTPTVPKTEVRPPEVVITDCQGEPESTPPVPN